LTRAWTESKETRGRKGMYLKLGRRYADVVCTSARMGMEEGREVLRMEMLWYGYPFIISM
jgi:hypothetical protein